MVYAIVHVILWMFRCLLPLDAPVSYLFWGVRHLGGRIVPHSYRDASCSNLLVLDLPLPRVNGSQVLQRLW